MVIDEAAFAATGMATLAAIAAAKMAAFPVSFLVYIFGFPFGVALAGGLLKLFVWSLKFRDRNTQGCSSRPHAPF